MRKLKPCPFCGEPPQVVFEEGINIAVRCGNPACNLEVYTVGLYETDAKIAWNHRAKPGK